MFGYSPSPQTKSRSETLSDKKKHDTYERRKQTLGPRNYKPFLV